MIILTPCIDLTWSEYVHSLLRSLVILFYLQVLVFVAVSLTLSLFFCLLQIYSERGEKKILLFLLVMSYAEPSSSFVGSKPRDPSACCLCLKSTTYLFHVSSGKTHWRPSDGANPELSDPQNIGTTSLLLQKLNSGHSWLHLMFSGSKPWMQQTGQQSFSLLPDSHIHPTAAQLTGETDLMAKTWVWVHKRPPWNLESS